MRLTKDFFEQVRSRVLVSSLVASKVTLTKKGREYGGLCPFHNEKTPSFTVNDIKRFYHCFGCGAHGDVIKFHAETTGLAYKDAATDIAKKNNIDIPTLSPEEEKAFKEIDYLYEIMTIASNYYSKSLNDKAKNYLDKRHIDQNETASKYGIGYVSKSGGLIKYLESCKIPIAMMQKAGLVSKGDNGFYEVMRDRVIFPIRNQYAKVIAFGGRAFGDAMPKYLNSPETMLFKKNEALYGEDIAIGEAYKKSQIIVAEGYIDVIAMQSHGFVNSVATLGTSCTLNHIQKMWRIVDEIIFCFDGDNAGLKASRRVIDKVLTEVDNDKSISFIILPSGLDPDEIINKHGKDQLLSLHDRRLSLSEMIWYLETMDYDYSSAEKRAKLEACLDAYAQKLKNTFLQRNYKSFFKEKVWELFRGRKKLVNGGNVGNKLSIVKDKGVESCILATILIYPSLLTDESVQEDLALIKFKDNDIGVFLKWVEEQVLQDNDINTDKLHEIAKKTSFAKNFVLISGPKSSFAEIKNTSEPKLLWELFVKKQYLIKAQEEYKVIASDLMADNAFEKLQDYQAEIKVLEKELEQLTERFIEQ